MSDVPKETNELQPLAGLVERMAKKADFITTEGFDRHISANERREQCRQMVSTHLAPVAEVLRECRQYVLDWQVHCALTSELTDNDAVIAQCAKEIREAVEMLAKLDALLAKGTPDA